MSSTVRQNHRVASLATESGALEEEKDGNGLQMLSVHDFFGNICYLGQFCMIDPAL